MLLSLRHGAASREGALLAALLRALETQGFLTANQITLVRDHMHACMHACTPSPRSPAAQGFRRLLDTLDDLVLDYPRCGRSVGLGMRGNSRTRLHIQRQE